ncbi:MAG: HypC/HybG/HupF family hydrogenase formation chaperone [Gammaproteobacteria bacterium]|nr:HypC/HybG/HupF family hydrogenase formation chaperone [Gammaproteobacteria bacterium]
MCIGIPMKIVEQREFTALCRGRGGETVVDTLLIGPQPEGTWIITFLGSAREVISADEANRISDALELVEAVMSSRDGVDLNAPFADLLDPSRPPGGYIVKRSGE